MEDSATGLGLVSGVELLLILAISRLPRTQSSSQAAQSIFSQFDGVACNRALGTKAI